MTILVLLFLAVMWAAVLAPAFFRNRAEGRSADSIGDFRRQLGVLQRTGPNLVNPANRLGHGEPFGSVPLLRGGMDRPSPYSARYSPQRQRTMQRRRDVLLVLICGLFGSAILGAIPSFRMIWAFTGVMAAVLGAYVALLVRMRSIEAEREAKLTYLPRPAAPEPALLLRRSVN